MNVKEFKETIEFKELASTNDMFKFMYKSYLKVLLKGGMVWEPCRAYSVGCVTAPCLSSATDWKKLLKTEIEIKEKHLVESFKKMKKEKKWVIEWTNVDAFDENGNLIDFSDDEEHIVSRVVKTKFKETFYLDDSLQFKPLVFDDV